MSTVTLVCGMKYSWSSAQFNIRSSLPFKSFLNDLFLFVENSDLSNYTDDNTLDSSGKWPGKSKTNLEGRLWSSSKMALWELYGFKLGQMLFYVFAQNTVNETFVYNNTEIKNCKYEKILGVIINNKLNN